jgi:dephospho-CoA kinase
MIIAVSGKSGSGKSSISSYLTSKLNCKLLEIDKITKTIRDEIKNEIIDLVGNDKIVINNKIDSKLLGNILFNDKMLLDKYNKLIYSKLKIVIEKEILINKMLVIDSIFLPIMEIFNQCDYKILVICDESLRKSRIINRDKIDEKYLTKRERFAPVYNDEDFDYIINNDKDYKEQVDQFIKENHLK